MLDGLADRLYPRIQARIERREREREQKVLSQVSLQGIGIEIKGSFKLTGAKGASIGNNVHIGDNFYARAEGGLVIGDNAHISRNVTVYTISHEYEGEMLPYDARQRYRPVTIGRNVWIGMNVSIAPGTQIGDGAIIGMGTTVSGVVPPMAVVVAPRAHILTSRDEARYARLDAEARWGGASGVPVPADMVAQFRPTTDRAKPFFVVSTGRSGSTTIARALSQHSEVVCLHEPRVQLIQLSTQWAHRTRPRDEIQADLERLYSTTVVPTTHYGESDQNLSLLLEPLQDLFPEAPVLWLIRDGRDMVASAYTKGWYQPGPHADGRRPIWDQFRLQGDACGDIPEDEWATMTAFAKNCWYWSFVNRTIGAHAKERPPDQVRRVRLEDLARETDEVFRSIGVEPQPAVLERTNAGRVSPKGYLTWSAEKHETFEQYCGAEMDRWYPGWRSPSHS